MKKNIIAIMLGIIFSVLVYKISPPPLKLISFDSIQANEALAQNPGAMTGQNSSQFNYSVGGVPVTVLAFNQSRLGWSCHVEGSSGNVRCRSGLTNGTITLEPTASSGLEWTAGGYFSNQVTTNPALQWDCIAETGTIAVSCNEDYR